MKSQNRKWRRTRVFNLLSAIARIRLGIPAEDGKWEDTYTLTYSLQVDWPLLEPETAKLVTGLVQRRYFCVEILLSVVRSRSKHKASQIQICKKQNKVVQ